MSSKSVVMASVALAALSCAGQGAAETIKARYSLHLMGLSIGGASATGYVEPQGYRVDLSMRTSGLANLVATTKGAATASGQLGAGGPSPAAYANTITNENETRTVRMSLAGGAVRAYEVKPEPWDAAVRVPLDESARRHVLDPVSALIMAVPPGQSLAGPAACDRTISVFDGVTRFDIRLTYAGEKTAQTKGYAGPVTVCSARYSPIAGYRPDSAATKFMTDNHDMTVWLAPLPEAHVVVPLRIDIRTAAGMLVVDASEFQIGQKTATGSIK